MSFVYKALRGQFSKILSGSPWYGDSAQTILSTIDAETANLRPVPDAHTIWEILNHITVWTDVARSRITTGVYYSPGTEEDWPPTLEVSDEAWAASITTFETAWNLLTKHVEALSDRQLEMDAPAATPSTIRYSVADLLHGILQHTVYHLGQISLLAKAKKAGNT